jgi:hypothetical protein
MRPIQVSHGLGQSRPPRRHKPRIWVWGWGWPGMGPGSYRGGAEGGHPCQADQASAPKRRAGTGAADPSLGGKLRSGKSEQNGHGQKAARRAEK